jgi:hypothetical protein
MVVPVRRKAQFFIITAVLVAGSLSITINVLDDYTGIDYDEVTTSSGPAQFRSIQTNIDSLWYEETWSHRRQVVVFERAGRDVEQYPVSIQLDTETLIEQGKMQESCGDLRVVEDGTEIPYQIEEGTCNTAQTTVWFLTSVRTDSRSESVELYYGNDNIQAPEYPTDIQVNEDEEAFRNDVVTFQAGTSQDDTTYGLYEARRLDTFNLAQSPLIFSGDPDEDEFEILEEGPVYVTIGFNATHNYTLFSSNNFLRRNGNLSVDSDTSFWYGEDSTVLSHWEAGSTANQHNIAGTDTWSGTFSDDQLPYVGALNTTTEEGIMFMTDTTSLPSDITSYTAVGGTNDGIEDRIGFGPSSGSMTIPHLDISFEDSGLPTFRADIHSNPPLATVTNDEQTGSFVPAAGWTNKARITLEERNGTSLESYPVNISLNLGRLDVRDDCQDLIVVERGQRQPHLLRDDCDSRSYDEPDGYTARWALDEGYGDWANDTTGTFEGEFRGTDDPVWEPGRFGFALTFDGQNRLFVDEDPPLELRNTDFTISLWFRASMTQQDFGGDVELLQYPDDTPGFQVINQTGEYVLQGLFTNGEDDTITVEGSTDIQDQPGAWHHAALRYDRNDQNLTVFLDGQQDGSTTVTGDLKFESNDFRIGEGFNGTIDELKVYTLDISPDAIRDQAVTETELTFLTDLTAFATESDVELFAGNTAGINVSYGPEDIPATTIDDPDDRPRVVSITEPQDYSEAIDRFEAQIDDAGLGAVVDLSVSNQCTDIQFESGGFNLEDRVC